MGGGNGARRGGPDHSGAGERSLTYDVLVSRLQYVRYDELDDQQAVVWERLVAIRKSSLVNEEGGLTGPCNAWIHAPVVGAALAELGAVLHSSSSIDPRLIEVAIITTGAHWKAEFEWWAHARRAFERGVSRDVIDAIGRGEPPTLAADDERVVYDVAQDLATAGRVNDDVYAAAHALLGDTGMVELVALCGYYALISFTLNAFTVPLPTGEQPKWPAT
jgi:4-carboxymuconolactone decarboxylase